MRRPSGIRSRPAPYAAALVVLLLPVSLFAAAADTPDVVHGRLFGASGQVVADITIDAGWHVNAHQPRDEFLIPTALEVVAPAGVRAGAVEYPAPVERHLAFAGEKAVLVYEATVRLTARLDGTPEAGAGPVRATLRYQACSDTRCLPPRTLELVAAPTEAGAALSAGAASSEVEGWVARLGWPLTFLWVAVLGLALNLTPCVYPLISVTVAFFGGSTGDGRRPVAHALAYVLGICVTFSALGVAAALTGSMFGAALQRPIVLEAIAMLLVLLALGNLGLYQFRVPSAVMQRAGRVGEGWAGALFMGSTMGIVAAPCIGPVVLALLLFVGARQSVGLGFALFFTLALGMGAPYLGLAAVAGHLRRLPRAGAWLEWMERLFAFLLLGLALYFVAPLLDPGAVRGASAFLGVTAGVVLGFLGPRTAGAGRRVRQVGGLTVIVATFTWLLAGGEPGTPIAWAPFSDASLAGATAAGRPVLIDFTADWCLPCREMDRTTFRDPAVVRAASSFTTLRVDATGGDEQVNALLGRFSVPGVPAYVLLGPDGREHRRLVGFVGAGEMRKALEDLAGSRRG